MTTRTLESVLKETVTSTKIDARICLDNMQNNHPPNRPTLYRVSLTFSSTITQANKQNTKIDHPCIVVYPEKGSVITR